MNELQQTALFGFFLFAVLLVANGVMVACGVAAPILGHAEQELLVRFVPLRIQCDAPRVWGRLEGR